MIRASLFLILWAFSWMAFAGGTFVGNGGGAGDIELNVARQQIEQTFKVVQTVDAGADLCRCNRVFESRGVCGPLRSLSDEQKKFCAATLKSQAPQILSLIRDERATFEWTNQDIQVNDGSVVRAVDAVANAEKKTITLNLRRFLELKPFERVYLLTHELMHLTDYQGKPMEDTGAVGPFPGEQGGRQLLNTMGAAAAVMQAEYPREIKRYKGKLRMSKAYKKWWGELAVGSARNASQDQTFGFDHYSRTQLTARYSLGDWVLAVSWRNESNDKIALTTIHAHEDKNIFGIGGGYRFFPFGDPETYWGQSHFLLQGLVDFVSAEHKVNDDFASNIEEKNTVGASGQLSFYLPFFWGTWWHMGLGYEYHPYKYDSINVKYDKGLTTFSTGVAYGF